VEESPEAPPRGPSWIVRRPELRIRSLLVGWALAAAGLLTAALVLPGLRVEGVLGAFGVVAVIGILNALTVPAIARIRLPFTVLSGFLVVLVLDAAVLWIAAGMVSDAIVVDTQADAGTVRIVEEIDTLEDVLSKILHTACRRNIATVFVAGRTIGRGVNDAVKN